MSNINVIRFAGICTVSCALLMFFLFITMGQSNAAKNGFSRHFPATKPTVASVVNLSPEGDFYIAGHSSTQIYTGNRKKPFDLWVGNTLLHLNMPAAIKGAWLSSRLSVDSPYIYLSDGVSPNFLIGDLHNLQMNVFMRKSSYFTTAANISPGSFAVRAMNAISKQNMLLKIQSDSPYVIQTANPLTKQVDGIFCTDGLFKYDRVSHMLLYMYYYRNQCLLLDTNLHLLRTIHTIDTTTVAKIAIATVSDKGNATLSAPPSFVNTTACIYADNIYIRSALVGDNEDIAVLDSMNLVDVYSIKDGRYLQTFYIPKQQHESLREMYIVKDQLIALYPHFYVTYNLPSGQR